MSATNRLSDISYRTFYFRGLTNNINIRVRELNNSVYNMTIESGGSNFKNKITTLFSSIMREYI
jgi:hypothetical protein